MVRAAGRTSDERNMMSSPSDVRHDATWPPCRYTCAVQPVEDTSVTPGSPPANGVSTGPAISFIKSNFIFPLRLLPFQLLSHPYADSGFVEFWENLPLSLRRRYALTSFAHLF